MVSSLISAGRRGVWAASLLGLLGTGCQSGRVAFRFAEPVARAPVAAQPAAAVRADSGSAAVEAAPPAVRSRHQVLKALTSRLAARQRQQVVAASVPSFAPAASPTLASSLQKKPRRGPWLRRTGQRPAAESGLGTTVIGVLGIPVLAVGLIGLAFGGGLTFGILAGAGALALLVAYLDPFG